MIRGFIQIHWQQLLFPIHIGINTTYNFQQDSLNSQLWLSNDLEVKHRFYEFDHQSNFSQFPAHFLTKKDQILVYMDKI